MSHYWMRNIHISWHIAALAVGVVLGDALLLLLHDRVDEAALPVIAAALFFVVVVRRWRWLLGLSLLAGVLVGVWRGAIEQQKLTAYKPYYATVVRISGRVSEDISYGSHGDQRLRLRHILLDERYFPGELWVSTATHTPAKRGDIVAVEGKLQPGFGNLAGAMYRARVKEVTRPYPGDIGRRARDWFAAVVQKGIPDPQASLGLGYLTGQRSTMPDALDEQIRVVGLTHAVVASGYNLTILVLFARRALAGVSKYLATLAAAGMIIGFIAVTGLSPSMSRAGLVAGLGLAAWYYGRTIHPFVLLPFAAAITVLVDPSYVWGDLGWYLSFAAFAGVLVLGPLLRAYFWDADSKPNFLHQIVLDTSAAQAATLPIILCAFGQYSTYALLSNVLVLPLVPMAMLLTFLTGAAGLLWPAVATWVGLPAHWLLSYMISVIDRIASLPDAQQTVHFGLAALVGSYIGLGLLCLFLRYKTGYRFRGGMSA